jgi:phosphatidylglycerophosphate synthase
MSRITPIAMAPEETHTPRRVLATRHSGWARSLARRLGRAGVQPNSVSIASVVFALVACAAFSVVPDLTPGSRPAALVLAAATIQVRLLCNLLDGMLAVEEGLKTRTGDIYNDLPDRLADVLILVGAGYSIREIPGGSMLGWAAAVTAVLTAYVRLLGGSLGATQHFIGPMAKQHRMFTLTIAALVAAVEAMSDMPPRAMRIALVVIVAGSIVTFWRRTARIMSEVDTR